MYVLTYASSLTYNNIEKGLWKLDTVPLILHMHAYIVAVTSNVI